jgi:hypothetical protein
MRGRQALDGLEPLPRALLLKVADDRVEDHHEEDRDRLGDIGDDRGENRRAKENEDQRVVELFDEEGKLRFRPRLRQHVGAVEIAHRRNPVAIEPLLGVHTQLVQQRLDDGRVAALDHLSEFGRLGHMLLGLHPAIMGHDHGNLKGVAGGSPGRPM